ncbi:monooxygenase [Coprinopsis cinerea okayama7|uniref:Monooxygenase n=1 Tax=Coprinopsis cinerea (strain Okayama-7 / 130 / ATCC MYA-4618 / FGSC 9003) TaxID=240176 RepID=A8PAG5_COPC7|nr:monooxygenase [Coprinopsis cinerea okayama7\|eukprot:XP_001839983.2 monooxygenase [Coprinopsis cinerea okayama7\
MVHSPTNLHIDVGRRLDDQPHPGSFNSSSDEPKGIAGFCYANSKLNQVRAMAPTIAIIGAGAGGLTFAIKLKRQLGYENFVIYEKHEEVGGTWRDNVYPGCSSDIPTVFYSLSTDLHDWPGSHGSQPEILDYWKGLADKYHLYPHIRFHHNVVSATWDESTSRYEITLSNTATQEQQKTYAEILVSAVGVLENPRYANIPGLGMFQGSVFHSARWDRSVDLTGKRVAVIGNGTSAAQFVPVITQDPSVEVVNFCRTPNWFMPPIRTQYSAMRRWLTRNIPLLNRIMRYSMFITLESLYLAVFSVHFPLLRPLMTAWARRYMTRAAPSEELPNLFPKFPMGCKRIIFDTGYLPALHRPNLHLNWDGIDSIVENGIVTKKSEFLPFDVIIFATGFSADVYPLPVYGRDGESIKDYFNEQNGAKAYCGTTVPKFPNFFILLGPNTTTGHTSVIFSTEVQVDYTFQLIKPILEGSLKAVEPKVEPTDAYDKHIQKRMKNSVFVHCLSWYRVGGEGKVTNMFPGCCRTPILVVPPET